MTNRVGFIVFAIFVLAAAALPASAKSGSNNDRVQFGSSISVSEDEQVGDLVCIGCSIHVAGTCGDIVAIGGRVELEGHARGDVVAVGGGVRLGENAQVGGDVVTIGGATCSRQRLGGGRRDRVPGRRLRFPVADHRAAHSRGSGSRPYLVADCAQQSPAGSAAGVPRAMSWVARTKVRSS